MKTRTHIDVCLVHPPNSGLDSQVPIGLLSIATYLKAASYTVSVVDAAPLIINGKIAKNKNIYSSIAGYLAANLQSDIYGFSTITTLDIPSLQISQCLKKLLPKSKIVFGNQWASAMPREIMSQFNHIDCIVVGEGEHTFKHYADTIKEGLDLSDVNGVVYRNGSRIQSNPRRENIADLDSLPQLDYSLLHVNIHNYRKINKDVMGLAEYGRGCRFNCSFCSTSGFWRHEARLFSIGRTISEINQMTKQGINSFMFTFDNFGSDMEHCGTLLRQIRAQCAKSVSWLCRCRVDCLNDKLIEMMAAAGCAGVLIGAESASHAALRSMRKRITVDQTIEAIRGLLRAGIQPLVSLVVGMPSETRRTLDMTMNYACRISALHEYLDPKIHLVSPLPGSLIAMKQPQRKLIPSSEDGTIAPDFSHYLEWKRAHRGNQYFWLRYKKDQRLIEEHPILFSSYYNFANEEIDRKLLASVTTYYNHMVRFYPLTILFLTMHRKSCITNMLLEFEKYCKRSGFSGYSLRRLRMYADKSSRLNRSLIGRVIRLWRLFILNHEERHAAIRDILRYETMLYECAMAAPPSACRDRSDFSRSARRSTICCSDTFAYDIIRLSDDVRADIMNINHVDMKTYLFGKKARFLASICRKGGNVSIEIHQK